MAEVDLSIQNKSRYPEAGDHIGTTSSSNAESGSDDGKPENNDPNIQESNIQKKKNGKPKFLLNLMQ